MGNTGPESTVPRVAPDGGGAGHAGVGSTEPAKSEGAGFAGAVAGSRPAGAAAGEGRA